MPVAFSIAARPGPSLMKTFRRPMPLKSRVARSVLEMNLVSRMIPGLLTITLADVM